MKKLSIAHEEAQDIIKEHPYEDRFKMIVDGVETTFLIPKRIKVYASQAQATLALIDSICDEYGKNAEFSDELLKFLWQFSCQFTQIGVRIHDTNHGLTGAFSPKSIYSFEEVLMAMTDDEYDEFMLSGADKAKNDYCHLLYAI